MRFLNDIRHAPARAKSGSGVGRAVGSLRRVGGGSADAGGECWSLGPPLLHPSQHWFNLHKKYHPKLRNMTRLSSVKTLKGRTYDLISLSTSLFRLFIAIQTFAARKS